MNRNRGLGAAAVVAVLAFAVTSLFAPDLLDAILGTGQASFDRLAEMAGWGD